MSNDHRFTAGEGAIWMQPDGPGTDLTFLGCHQIESIDEPLGDYTPLFCPDNSRSKAWKTVGQTASPPGAVTATITEDVTSTLSYLRESACPFPVYVNMVSCGRRDVFENAVKTFILDVQRVTNRSIANPVMMESDERVQQSFDLAGAPPLIEVREVTTASVVTAETDIANDIFFYSELKCADTCGEAQKLGQKGIIGYSADGVYPDIANVEYTEDSGVTWGTAVGPFGAGEDIVSVTAFSIDKDIVRWLVTRDEVTVPPTGPEVGYSDDSGATWTIVEVDASVLGAVDSGALFSLDKRHVWLALSDGYIFFSDDGGETWTAQSEGTVTAQDLHGIHFSSYFDGVAVGGAGVVLITSDGGDTWTAVTSITGTPVVNCVYMFDSNRFVVGTEDGHIYMTFDGGTTWESKYFYSGGTIDDIDFTNKFTGWAVKNSAAPVGTIIRTRDGGETWETITTPTNTGLNAIDAITENLAWAVGESSRGPALIKAVG